MTTTADADTTDPVVDDAGTASDPDTVPSDKKSTAKPPAKTHTNVPAPLAGPARRTALALGVPSVGLAELLMHANFGWAGVAAFTTAAAVGAGVVYTARRKQRTRTASKEGSKVGAAKTPSSLAAKLRAKPLGDSPARAGHGASRGGLASRIRGRFGGRAGGFGRRGGLGHGGGLGRSRGVAGRSNARAGLGTTSHAGAPGARRGKSLTSPGARTAAAKAAHLTGGRPSKTSAGLRRLASGSAHHTTRGKTGHSGSGSKLGGGSFFGGRGTRPSTTRGSRSRHGGRPHSPISERRGHGSAAAPSRARHRHNASRRPRARRAYRLAAKFGRYAVVPLSVPAVVAGAVFAGTTLAVAGLAVGGVYGACRLASSPRVRYGASVIAGWMRLGFSRAYQWARAQWWKTRGRTTAADRYVVEGETVDEPRRPASGRASSAKRADIIDAEVVPDETPASRATSTPFSLPPFRLPPATPKPHSHFLCQWTWPDEPDRRCSEPKSFGGRYCDFHQRAADRATSCTWELDPGQPFGRLCGAPKEKGKTYCPYHQACYDALPLVTPPPELPAAARQPKLTHATPAPAGAAPHQHQEIPIVSALDDITASVASAPAFTPASGHDAEQYLDSIVTLLDALGGRVSSDLQTIGEHLPQEAAALGTLGSLGEVLTAFASQAGEQVEAWKQTANWVWRQG